MKRPLLVIVALYWFFAVDVSEQWPQYDRGPRARGGWTHDGPYKTKAGCEQARSKIPTVAYQDESHAVWYATRPCRSEHYDPIENRLRPPLHRFPEPR